MASPKAPEKRLRLFAMRFTRAEVKALRVQQRRYESLGQTIRRLALERCAQPIAYETRG